MVWSTKQATQNRQFSWSSVYEFIGLISNLIMQCTFEPILFSCHNNGVQKWRITSYEYCLTKMKHNNFHPSLKSIQLTFLTRWAVCNHGRRLSVPIARWILIVGLFIGILKKAYGQNWILCKIQSYVHCCHLHGKRYKMRVGCHLAAPCQRVVCALGCFKHNMMDPNHRFMCSPSVVNDEKSGSRLYIE